VLIPQTTSEITPQWLGHVLGVAVESVRVECADNGTTGRATIAIDYAQPCELPARLFVKLPPADVRQRAFVTSNGMGIREARFYQQLSADFPLRVPRCYFADQESTGERYIMLLEHLQDSGCTFRNAASRYSLGYLREVLAAFASLHAYYWQSPRFDTDLSWVGPIRQHEIARQLLARALSAHGASMPPIFSQLCELYLDHENAIHSLWRQGPVTLIHGDVHDGNLFYDERRGVPGFLDWALLAQGPGMRDVAYFLAGTLSPEEQLQEYPALLQFYRDALQRQGVSVPGTAQMDREYALQAVYPWLGAAVTLAMGDAWQDSTYVRRSLDRLHNTLGQLRSLERLREALNLTA
jgi:aminoglycoside phosphotransferase (APT) family kinase protein